MKTTFKGQHPEAETDPEGGWRHLLEASGRLARHIEPSKRQLLEIARGYDRIQLRAQGQLQPDATETDILAALLVIRALREKLDADELALMTLARTKRITWARMATALGMKSRQSAERRHLQLTKARPRPDGTVDTRTQNDRVEAHREQRRRKAELDWALNNAQAIGSLATRLGGLSDLQQRADGSREARLMAAISVPTKASSPAGSDGGIENRQMTWPARLKACVAEYERFQRSPEEYVSEEDRALGDEQWQLRRTKAELAHRLLGLVGQAADERDIDLSDHPDLAVGIARLITAFRSQNGHRRRDQ
ncbi:hypothetical protein HET69_25400 [Streptomyces sp. CJ_13]|uniref:hypothetical protein n=1 Tax=Streptomyces sp. CJ_13 TaxID=2724943 RepID=UPI001BDDB2E7|nr:hypothetical protein [Streptomyces sp. CJ_13]MBT1187242.1 hypothetical protein [Streptomyces sp. CJ_13]